MKKRLIRNKSIYMMHLVVFVDMNEESATNVQGRKYYVVIFTSSWCRKIVKIIISSFYKRFHKK